MITMDFQTIINAEEIYEKALLEPGFKNALLNVIIAGIIIGFAALIISNNPIGLIGGIIINLIQWFTLTATLWLFYIMFKNKRSSELTFDQISSATGKLWSIVIFINLTILIIAILTRIQLFSEIFSIILFIIFFVLGLAMIYSYYKLIKTMFLSNKGRHIIVWFFTLIFSGFISGSLISLVNLVL
jgi:hypothetical protein